MDAVKSNMQKIAAEKRIPRMSFAVQGGTAAASRNAVQASGTYQKMVSGPPPHRVVFVYSVGDAYDRMPPGECEYDRRLTTPSPVWAEDFAMFLDCCSPMITSENQNVAAVLSGFNKRTSSGLLTEAGLTNANEMIQLVKKNAEKPGGESCPSVPWRVKSLTLNMEEDSFMADRISHRKGTGGSLTQTLFFFYRGTWPNALPKEARGWFGGSTWGDVWKDVKAPIVKTLPKIRIEAKRKIFADAWAQLGTVAKLSSAEEAGGERCLEEEPKKKKKKQLRRQPRRFSFIVTMTSWFGNSSGGSGSSMARSSGQLALARV